MASKLAYYEGPWTFGIVAPKNWDCGLTYGSSGAHLVVSPPAPTHSARLTGSDGILVSIHDGGTSGRFAVARYIHQLFPKLERQYVRNVANEGIVKKEHILVPPFQGIRLKYKREDIVEFSVPPNFEKANPAEGLAPSSHPIRGVVMLLGRKRDLHLLVISVRLPQMQNELTQAIIADAERAYDLRDRQPINSTRRRRPKT